MARVSTKARRPASFVPPRSLAKKVEITCGEMFGWPVYRVSPTDTTPSRASVYFHGGAYIWEITGTHWRVIAALAARTNTTFVVPIYPLAPAATAERTVAVATSIAGAVVDEFGPGNVVLMGDSAGGGMALAVAQQRRDSAAAPNAHIVLISPWLDVGMTDPQIAVVEPRDPWLGIEGTKLAGTLYRGELPATDPRVSPLYGDMTELAPVTMFTGTRDIANVDARSLARLARSSSDDPAALRLTVHEVPDMVHVYPLLPIPEGRRARAVIEGILTDI